MNFPKVTLCVCLYIYTNPIIVLTEILHWPIIEIRDQLLSLDPQVFALVFKKRSMVLHCINHK